MKKFLSLVLSLVMVISLVQISAGAKEFTDDDSITYQEAIDVISTIGVIDGYTDGSFKPTDNLTRGAAAKIICNLVLGPTTAGALSVGTAPFPDVPATSTFAGNIAYCANQGIINGYNDGTFKPGASLSGNAFMKMLLGALGYSAKQEGYTGANWSVNVAKDALGIGLADDLVEDFNGAKTVTREEACLYAFNTLSATMVEYSSNVTADLGTLGTISMNSPATNVRWSTVGITNDGNIRQDGFVQFAEKYFEKLVKTRTSDDFRRPAYTWTWDKNVEIGTYVDDSLLLTDAYTKEVKGGDIYNLVGSTTLDNYTLEVYVDGVEWATAGTGSKLGDSNADKGSNAYRLSQLNLKSAGNAMENTGNGVVTEVYLERPFLSVWDYSGSGTAAQGAKPGVITICIINTWLAQATSNYSTSDKDVAMKVFYSDNGGSTQSSTKTVKLEDVPAIEGMERDEFILVNMSGKGKVDAGTLAKNSPSEYDVVIVAEPEILEDSTVTKFSAENKGDGSKSFKKLTTGGTQYDKAEMAFYDADVLDTYDDLLLTGITYNIYMDPYGYFIGVDIYSGTKNYVFIPGYDTSNSHIFNSNATASAIFLDGSMETITVNRTDTNKNIEAAWDRARNVKNIHLNSNGKTDVENYYETWSQTGNGGITLLNRWYTYSTTSAGVYTLKPVMNNTTGEVRMIASSVVDDGKLEDYSLTSEEDTIKCNNVRLDGVKSLMQTTTNRIDVQSLRAYGEDDSVFLVVENDQVDKRNFVDGGYAITGVRGVYTGVQNVELIVKNSARWTDKDGKDFTTIDKTTAIPESVYTVYDTDHYIIGSIIVGEAKGGVDNYAYIIEAPTSEEKIDDTYYWEFDCFNQGEKKTLTVKSKFASVVNTLVSNEKHIVELQFDGEYVTGVRELRNTSAWYDTADAFDRAIKDETVYDVEVARHESGTSTIPAYDGELYLQGRTLYVSKNQQDRGLTFTSGAHAYVIQEDPRDPGDDKKSVYDSVSEAVDRLTDLDTIEGGKQWSGIIHAALNSNGVAEWVVFDSWDSSIKHDYAKDGYADNLRKGNGTIETKYTLTVGANGTVLLNGNAAATGAEVKAGDVLTITPATNFEIAAVTGATLQADGTYKVDEKSNVSVTFKAAGSDTPADITPDFDTTDENLANVKISYAGDTVNVGDTFTIEGVPAEGYTVTVEGATGPDADGNYTITDAAVKVTITKDILPPADTKLVVIMNDAANLGDFDETLFALVEDGGNVKVQYNGQDLDDSLWAFRAAIVNNGVVEEGTSFPKAEGLVVFVQGCHQAGLHFSWPDSEIINYADPQAGIASRAVTRMSLTREATTLPGFHTLTLGENSFDFQMVQGQDENGRYIELVPPAHQVPAILAALSGAQIGIEMNTGREFTNVDLNGDGEDDIGLYAAEGTDLIAVTSDSVDVTVNDDGTMTIAPKEGYKVYVDGEEITTPTTVSPDATIEVAVDASSLTKVEPTASLKQLTFDEGTVLTADDFNLTNCEFVSAEPAELTADTTSVTLTVKAKAGEMFDDNGATTTTFTFNVTVNVVDHSVIDALEVVMTPEKPVAGQEEPVTFAAGECIVEASAEVDTSVKDTKGQKITLTVTAPEGKTFAETVIVSGDTDSMSIYKRELNRTSETTLTIDVTVKVGGASSIPSGNENMIGAAITGEFTAPSTAGTIKIYTIDGKAAGEGDIIAAIARAKGVSEDSITVKGTTATIKDLEMGSVDKTYTVTNASGEDDVLKTVTINGKQYSLGAFMTVTNLDSSALMSTSDGPFGSALDDTVDFDDLDNTSENAYVYDAYKKTGIFVAGPDIADGDTFSAAVTLTQPTNGKLVYDGKEVDNTADAVVEGTEVAVKYTVGAAALNAGAWAQVKMNTTEIARVQGAGATVTTETFALAAGQDGACTLADTINMYKVAYDGKDLKFDDGSDLSAITEGTTKIALNADASATAFVNEKGEALTEGTAAGNITTGKEYMLKAADDNNKDGTIEIFTAVSLGGKTANDPSSLFTAAKKLNTNGDDLSSTPADAITLSDVTPIRKGETGAVYIKAADKNTTIQPKSTATGIHMEVVVAPQMGKSGIWKIWSDGTAIDATTMEVGASLAIDTTKGSESTDLAVTFDTDAAVYKVAAATVAKEGTMEKAKIYVQVEPDTVSAALAKDHALWSLPDGLDAEIDDDGVVTITVTDEYEIPANSLTESPSYPGVIVITAGDLTARVELTFTLTKADA